MNNQTPLATKIIITLLVLILAALGVILVQNARRSADTVSINDAGRPVPRYTEVETLPPLEPHVPPTTPLPNRSKPTVVPRTVAQPSSQVASGHAEAVAQEVATRGGGTARTGFEPPIVLAPVPADAGPVAGDISGRIFLAGTPPAEIPIVMDATCGRLQATPATTRHYVVNSEGALANVFVYVKKGLENRKFPVPATAPLLDNVNCMFEPYVMGVQAKQNFRIRNSDPFLHNAHITPTLNREKNVALAVRGQTITSSLPVPEVLVRVKCDVHPWMFAYIGVADHPFFAVSDTNGVFKLPARLSPGNYTIAAYHQKAGELTKDIVIRADEGQSIDFTFPVSNAKNLKMASDRP